MQTSTTTDKVSFAAAVDAADCGDALVLIWQLAAMAVNIPLLLPSPVAVLQRLWQLCGKGEFWYTVLTSLCRILLGFAAGVAAGVCWRQQRGDGSLCRRWSVRWSGCSNPPGRLLYHPGVGVGQNRAAGDPHLLYHGAAAGLQQSLSGDCCRGPESCWRWQRCSSFPAGKTFPAAVICRQFCLFPVGSQQCAGTCVEIGHRCRGAGQTADCHRDQNL